MVKVKSPLFSSTARGNLGKILIFTKSKAKKIVKKFFKSFDNKTEKRLEIRLVYSQGCSAWNLLTPAEKETYNENSKGKNLTGFNLFMREYLEEYIPLSNNGLYGTGLYDHSYYWED